MSEGRKIRVLFVCTGNICRSPLAEGVLRARIDRAGLGGVVTVDSAGTHDYHVGEPPDPRAREAAAQRGYDIGALRGRQVIRRDFREFDYVLAMDTINMRHLARLCPAEDAHKVRLLMEFAPDAGATEVPDPYYGGTAEFERVLDLIEAAADGFIAHLRTELAAGR